MEELLAKIKNLIEKQPVSESRDCYDDHGQYFDAGYYEGYVDALAEVLKIIDKKEI